MSGAGSCACGNPSCKYCNPYVWTEHNPPAAELASKDELLKQAREVLILSEQLETVNFIDESDRQAAVRRFRRKRKKVIAALSEPTSKQENS